ncbi:MAG: preprotein translocase subunit SecA [Deltaproteobacteria bacterium]|nr:preprotein translocase subunit SecA [Deltaproteobacteria bacterium]MBW1932060.1 preprotein translocase subunit SecA [Deltaproteobacteria bacterium]MBW1937595.1 preprotein translocase subunit SecA [Deltaproteobacteria bacterium]MBW1965030.1 preprotein translocase subunit SecA [Deltaproteobacteria bacterium]MBW2080548.1 preprotein translocase subunit SecA [Deltaproteobacteria bacterium]
MIGNLVAKVFGTKHGREVKKLQPLVDRINSLESGIKPLSDEKLKAKTPEFKERLERGESLDELLPETFAVTREAALRVLGLRPFDVQLMGGIVLHQGKIAEMKTGEGKTLVATMPVYLNALTGRGVHVITVNDYLATRDSEWMGQVYRFLGLDVGVIVHGLEDTERKASYDADVTYGTNNEFGFDYLKDNMKYALEDMVQREFYYAIVDEVDSILVDEARTPLIISGPSEDSTDLYYRVNQISPDLKKDPDFTVDEKARAVSLTEEGVAKCEKLLGVENLYDPAQAELLHHVQQALKAHALFKKDIDYLVKDGQVVIVDEFTGRIMPGRRYSDGLHQALEAKEGVKIESENQTLASITFQNFFRMYEKLAGMTGTAETEAAEFQKIYNLDVVVVPTHMDMIRKDYPDVVFKTESEKFEAAAKEIKSLHDQGRPVLVGSSSVDNSERLSKMLKRQGVKHEVLNAKHHEREAEIVAHAGERGRITIATNMAGRGTDIVLGEGVADMGGLHILSIERHESRRIDNQLRGRSGRQGDLGSSRFYLSLEDDLLRIFGSDRISGIMDKLGMDEGEPIEHSMLSKAIENAQRKVEGHNFEIRKHLLDYDDVMNKQREVIYSQRKQILAGGDMRQELYGFIDDIAAELVDTYTDEKELSETWDWKALEERLLGHFSVRLDIAQEEKKDLDQAALEDKIGAAARQAYDNQLTLFGDEEMARVERFIVLQTLDNLWKDHLLNMDHLREGIGLRGYGQKDPLQEYRREGYDMFMAMIQRFREEAISLLLRIRPMRDRETEELEARRRKQQQRISYGRGDGDDKPKTVKRKGQKVGRNDPCPCGSGKKYKKCCGKK